VRRLLTGYFHLYLGLTSVGFVMFLAGGMGPFDAITYSFTTISTGGFANHDQSFAHFQSATIEWLGVGGMLLGGLSLPLAWRALRGRGRSSIRSTELIVYVGLVAGTTTVLALTTDAGGWHDTIRASAFTAASAVSTTGHWVTDWTGWAPGPQMLLLVLIGVGSMSGSLGGGFRIVRAMALVSYVRRELLRQLLPRSIHPVRVGRQVIDEETTDRMVGYQVLFIGTAAVGFFAIALAGTDLVTALSASVSALATFGPALGALAPGTPLTEASDWILLVLMGLMFAGRVELYPVLNAVVSVVTAPRRLLRGREQSRQRRRLRDSGPRRGGDAGARR
jgi:trk system potassium uptake protein TrkH